MSRNSGAGHHEPDPGVGFDIIQGYYHYTLVTDHLKRYPMKELDLYPLTKAG